MGVCVSVIPDQVVAFVTQIECTYFTPEEAEDFKLILHLSTGDLYRLVNIFETFSPDADNEYTISINNFFNCLNLEKNILTARVYDVTDLNGDCGLSFYNFVLFTWHFLTMSDSDMQTFSFEVYNKSGSGKLQSLELHKAIGLVHGKSNEEQDMRKLCEEEAEPLMDIIDELPDKQMGLEEYLSYIDVYRCLLLPFYHLQSVMRQYIFGEPYWRHVSPDAQIIKKTVEVQTMFSTARAGMNAGQLARQWSAQAELRQIEGKYANSMHSRSGEHGLHNSLPQQQPDPTDMTILQQSE